MVRGWITHLIHRHRGKDYGEDFNLVVVVDAADAADAAYEGISREKTRNVIKKKREDIRY